MYSSYCNWRGHKREKTHQLSLCKHHEHQVHHSFFFFFVAFSPSNHNETRSIYNLFYNLWPELSVFCLRIDVLQANLWYYSGVTRKVLSFSPVLLMPSFRVVTMVVLLLPLLKISHSFSCRTVIWKSQNVSKQFQSPFCDSNWKWFCSYDLIQLYTASH